MMTFKSILFLILILINKSCYSKVYEEGIASYYKYGKTTANGNRFNTNALTAAHKYLPFGTRVKVTNLRNSKSVIVVINDRGPFVRGRIIDLTRAGKNAIGMGGLAKVSLEIINGG